MRQLPVARLVWLGLVGAMVGAPAGSAAAQTADSATTIDRIVAVVGTRPILLSEVQERILIELRGRPAPTDQSVLRQLQRGILESLVNEELVIQQASRDTTIKVTDEEITQSVDQLYRNVRGQYQSEEQFRTELQRTGFQTLEEWRTFSAEQQRRTFLANRFWDNLRQRGRVKDVPPTDEEMRQYFDQQKGNFEPRPELVSFKQIVIAPQPSDTAKAAARQLIDSILVELRKGADFATAARRFSMDPGTREQGGSLNWIRRGQGYDPRFESVAFSLRPGQISDPVETGFGFHLIQVERVQAAEVHVRHILIMPVIDSTNADSAYTLAERVRAALVAGASFDSLQRVYHDRMEEREIQQYPVGQLAQQAPGYGQAFAGLAEGGVGPVFQLPSPDPIRSKWAIVQLTRRIPAGEVRFEDVREQIRRSLARRLGEGRHLERMRKASFVLIHDV
ncbi:MAG: peptidylprolyl isomerase [Gemmatimonadales bacterium]|nr:peptidylprolyl isomerase [Gemmatimonadales bacterium]